MIDTPVIFQIKNFIKANILYIHDFVKVVGNNIRVLCLIFEWLYWSFNADVIACFWYFNNNIFAVITPFAFDNDHVSLIQIFRLHAWVLFAVFFFSAPKLCAKIFIEYQLHVQSNQIHVSVTVSLMRCLPPWIGG